MEGMMKKSILAVALGFLVSGLNAAQGPVFTDAFADQLNALPAAAREVKVEVPVKVEVLKAKTGRYVQVSGYVNLNGRGYVQAPNGGFTMISLTGWASFRDSSGYINESASMWIYPNQHVFQTVRPNVYAQFYRNGKPLGAVYMTGSVSVSGWPSGNYVSLNGSGYLTGSIYVEDEE